MNEVRPLRAYAEVVLGRQRSPEHDSGPHMVPYLRAANVKDGRLDLSDVKEMNFTPTEQATFALLPGDVLVTEGSGSIGAVGASSVWDGELPNTVCFQNTLLRLRPRPSTDPRFLAWWCRYAFGSGLFASVATGANIYHLSAERLRGLPVTYLPLDSQRAIADFLDAETARIDALITAKRSMIDLLAQRAEAVVSSLLWGRSNRWDGVRLKHLAGPPTSGNREHGSFTYSHEGVPCLRGLNVKPNRLVLTDLMRISVADHTRLRDTQLRPGDVVIVRSGLAGSAVAIPAGTGDCNCVDLVVVRRTPRLDPLYLQYVVNSTEAQEQVRQGRVGAILSHFNAVDAGDLLIPLRDLETQRHTVAAIEVHRMQHDGMTGSLARQIDLLAERRQALVTAAVTGEIEVPGVAA